MRKQRGDGEFPFWRVFALGQWLILLALLLFIVFTLRGQDRQLATSPLVDTPSRSSDAGQIGGSAISLAQAIQQALSPTGNARVAIAREMALQAKARGQQARAELLPHLDGAVSQSSQTRNLQALGIELSIPLPGFQPPRFVGPFNVFDARVSVTQQIFSMSSVRRYRAAREGWTAAQAEEQHARDSVATLVAKAYLAVQRAEAQAQAASATLTLARELEDLARKQREVGTGIALDLTRAQVQRSQAEQALLQRETERSAARLQLQRLMGMPLGEGMVVDAEMPPPLDDLPALDDALATALREREDLRAQQARQEGARQLQSAVRWERSPMVAAFGDYGASGNTPANALATRAVGLTARLPLFDGGRREARRSEAAAKQREEELRTRDLRQQVELDLRLALESLQSTRSQVLVALDAFQQSELELTQARRRFQAGVSNNLEVTRAQTTVEQSRVARIDALFRYHIARIEFAFASGRMDEGMQ
jgi:outer membrane protein TolC